MTVLTYLSTQTDPEARGRALGEAFAGGVGGAWLRYERIFAAGGVDAARAHELGESALQALDGWAPDLSAELRGIAAGAGLPAWRVAAVNARTEIMARVRTKTPGECSTAVVLPRDGGAPRTIQTWDWLQSLRDAKLLWRVELASGRVVKTFTELGVLGKIGVNDAGLGVHFNFLQHHDDGLGDGTGVPVHLVARRILDEASTVDEATAIARSAPVTASTALTVVTQDDARTLELSPAGVGVVAPDPDGVLLHTNHFLDPELAEGERLAPEDPDTIARYDELERRRAGLSAPTPEQRAEALVLHREDGAALCCHPELGATLADEWETLLTISLSVPDATLTYIDGAPCQAAAVGWSTF
jgi:isopenicillin-N N-acyltransferase-like protein